jgi:hypothetical protein
MPERASLEVGEEGIDVLFE